MPRCSRLHVWILRVGDNDTGSSISFRSYALEACIEEKREQMKPAKSKNWLTKLGTVTIQHVTHGILRMRQIVTA